MRLFQLTGFALAWGQSLEDRIDSGLEIDLADGNYYKQRVLINDNVIKL